jgi:hypothetical protein
MQMLITPKFTSPGLSGIPTIIEILNAQIGSSYNNLEFYKWLLLQKQNQDCKN